MELTSSKPRTGLPAALFSLLATALALWALYLGHVHRLSAQSGAPGWWQSASYCLMVASGLAIGVGILTTPFSLARRPWVGRAARVGTSLIGAVLLVSATIDNRLYEVMGVHLYDSSVTTLLGRGDVNASLHITAREVLLVSGSTVGCALALWLAGWTAARLLRPAAQRSWIVGVVLCGLLVVGWGGSRRIRPSRPGSPSSALPFYDLLFAPRAVIPTDEVWTVRYPRFDGPLPKLKQRPSFLLILAETLRGDMLTQDTMPELWALQSGPPCASSANHQASSHSTDHCVFSLLYGLHSYHYQILGKRNVPNFPMRILKENAYRVLGASSAPLSEWGQLSYVTEQFQEFFQAKGTNPVERDQDLLRWAMDFLAKDSGQTPFFLFVFFDSTHHKYYYPPEFEKFHPTLPEDHSLIAGDEQDPDVRLRFVNRYKNSVAFVDHSIGVLLRRFVQLGAGKHWMAAVTGDHGEEFWDHGLLGHASVSFTNERVRVPLVLCASDNGPLSLPLTSHVDVMPTFLDYAGMEPAVDAADFSSGVSLVRPQDPERLVLVSSIDFPEKNRQLALVSRTSKYLVWKEPEGTKAFRVTSTSDAQDVPSTRTEADKGRALQFLNDTYRRFFIRMR